MDFFRVRQHLHPDVDHASGTVIGEDHRKLLAKSASIGGTIQLGLDFSGIEFTTGSYLKRTLLWVWRCGEVSVSGQLNPDEVDAQFGGEAPVARAIFPFVCNLNDEVRSEISEVFAARGVPIMEALDWTEERILRGRVLGRAEAAVVETIRAVGEEPAPQVSAKSLCESRRDSGLGLSAWGNRLVELHRLRLLDRRKQSKEWIYLKLTEDLSYG